MGPTPSSLWSKTKTWYFGHYQQLQLLRLSNTQTDRHGNSMTDPAWWAESVKNYSGTTDYYTNPIQLELTLISEHPVYFQKTSAAPFGNRSPQLRGAWVCTWADLQNLQGGAAQPLQTETRWTERDEFLCLSDPLVKAPHFCRLLCWMGVARYSQNYSGWEGVLYSLNLQPNWHFNRQSPWISK